MRTRVLGRQRNSQKFFSVKEIGPSLGGVVDPGNQAVKDIRGYVKVEGFNAATFSQGNSKGGPGGGLRARCNKETFGE